MTRPEDQALQHPVRTFFRFFRFLYPYWDKVLFVLLGIMIAAPLGNMYQLFNKAIIDQVVMNDTDPTDIRLFFLFLFVALEGLTLWSGQLVERLSGFFNFYTSMFVTLRLRRKFYNHLHRLPYQFFQDRPIGEHMYRCLDDIRADGLFGARGVVDMITSNVTEIFKVLNDIFWQGMIVIVLNPVAAVFMGIIIVPHTILTWWMTTRIKRAYEKLKHEEQAVPAVLRDSIAGVETVKSYGRRRFMARRYVAQLATAIRANLGRDYLQLTMEQFVIWGLDLIAVGGLWTWLVYQLMIGEITVGSFYVLLNLSVRFIGPVKAMVNRFMLIRQQLVPAYRILQTLDVEPAIQDLPNPLPMPRVSGRVRFENVSFAYDPAVPVLRNVSFELEPGKTIGIVGRSGAGKTTILNLLLRLHRPSSGRILLDDHDLDKVRIRDWQNQVSIVLQNTFIFGGDVAYNVRYGKPHATDAEIWRALELSDSDEFVSAMPEGMHTDLAEGSKLSGGQKQRLGIARALVREPHVLILDEPTSSLDSRTENEIWRSFEKAMQGLSTIVVSHRLSTVRKADQIVVLERGEIAEKGSHDELVRLGGIYASMWQDQTGGAV
jgi:ABC-type multidrug transport system fused ATPase/permease subunit